MRASTTGRAQSWYSTFVTPSSPVRHSRRLFLRSPLAFSGRLSHAHSLRQSLGIRPLLCPWVLVAVPTHYPAFPPHVVRTSPSEVEGTYDDFAVRVLAADFSVADYFSCGDPELVALGVRPTSVPTVRADIERLRTSITTRPKDFW